jgi:hypothetical protein
MGEVNADTFCVLFRSEECEDSVSLSVATTSTIREVVSLASKHFGKEFLALSVCGQKLDMEHLFADYFEPDQIFILHFDQIVPDSVASAFSPVLKAWLGATAPLQLLLKTSDPTDVGGFHRACDGKANTLVIVRSKEGNIFGGFAVPAWGSSSPGDAYWKSDPTKLTFIFVLKNTFGDPPTRFPKKDNGHAIFCWGDYGPVFGGESGPEIDLWDHDKPYVHIRGGYIDKLGRGTAAFVPRGSGRQWFEVESYAFVSRRDGKQEFELESYEVWAAAGPPTPWE